MIRQRKTGSITVSRPARHRSQNGKTLRPLNPRHRSTQVIHVTIGLGCGAKSSMRSLPQIAKHPAPHRADNIPSTHQDQHSLQHPNLQTKKSLTQKSDSTKTSFLTRTSRVTHHEDMSSINQQAINSSLSQIIPKKVSKEKNQFFNQTGLTNDYHRKRKEKKSCKCSRRCFIVSLILTLLIIAIAVSVTLALLLKPQTTKTTATPTPILRWKPAGITVAGVTSTSGSGNTRLNDPADVILDWANNLYIADAGNNRIQKYLAGSLTSTTVAGNGTNGTSPFQLYNPSRVILDSNENLYVSDSYNFRVQFWSKGGINGTTIAGLTGMSGGAYNRLNTPYGLALHPTSGVLYICDYWNNRIMSYPPGARNGTLIFGGQGQGINSTQLYTPIGLHYDEYSKSLVIANFRANNIVRYVFNASNWTLVAGNINGTAGANLTSLESATDMTFDPMGNMYVADRNNHRIQFFSGDGANGTIIAGITRTPGNNATRLSLPWAVRLDSQLNMYVADTNNHRIQKFLRY